MRSHALRFALFVAAFGVVAQIDLVDRHTARAEFNHRRSVRGDLFYNYYAHDRGCNQSTPAQMYMAPLPAPPIVGHTYFTYQPLLPHEYMYGHHRDYWRATPGGSWSHTSVRYETGPRWFPGMWIFRP